MTHDELLAKIDSLSEDWPGDGKSKTAIALRAVGELHKPTKFWLGYLCKVCPDDPSLSKVYPCPTIRAIEKELAHSK